MATTTEQQSSLPHAQIERAAGGPGKRRGLRIFIFACVALVLVVAAGLLGVGWYFSSEALDATPATPSYNVRVLAIGHNMLTVSRASNIMRAGTYRLQWPGGGVTLGPILSANDQRVVRRSTESSQGLRVGTMTHFDSFMWSTPADLHLRYQNVNIRSPLGIMPAWYVPGRRSTWVVVMHGRGENRREALRPMATLAGLGLPVLDLSYRNDPGVPASPDHLRHLGASEWEDLQAGVQYALGHGARDVVLYGFSFGGSVDEAFLHRSAYAGRVRAVVLDAPALDWSATFDFRAAQRNIPGFITAIAKPIIAWRIGVSNLDAVTGVPPNADFRVRTLVMQGTGDTSVPYQPNLALARARPDLVTFVAFRGAEHTEAWNWNPKKYNATVRNFLTQVLRNSR